MLYIVLHRRATRRAFAFSQKLPNHRSNKNIDPLAQFAGWISDRVAHSVVSSLIFSRSSYQLGAMGTALVGGGGGGGGGGPPASDLTAPKPVNTRATHKHNFSFFIIYLLPSVICLKFMLMCLKMRTTCPVARHMPTKSFSSF
jgi:hypothetical protein